MRGELQRLADEGEAWPEPTAVETVALGKGAIPILVDVTVEDPAVRVNISMGERLLERVDLAAEQAGMSRSGFIAQAARAALGDRQARGASAEFDAVAKTLREEWSELGQRINENLGPTSAFHRNLAEFDNKISDAVRNAAESVSAVMTRRAAPEHSPVDPEAGKDHARPTT